MIARGELPKLLGRLLDFLVCGHRLHRRAILDVAEDFRLVGARRKSLLAVEEKSFGTDMQQRWRTGFLHLRLAGHGGLSLHLFVAYGFGQIVVSTRRHVVVRFPRHIALHPAGARAHVVILPMLRDCCEMSQQSGVRICAVI